MKLGYLPLKGSIRLVQIFSSIDLPGTYCIHKDGRMAIIGISAFADAARLTVDCVVLISIQWHTVRVQDSLSLVITGLYKKNGMTRYVYGDGGMALHHINFNYYGIKLSIVRVLFQTMSAVQILIVHT